MHDIIIVGAGPAGLYTAKLLENLDIAILESESRIGGKACSGLISKNLDNFVKVPKSCVENEASTAIVHSPKETLKLDKRGAAAYVLNRELFDSWLAEKVKDKIQLSTAVEKIAAKNDFVEVQTNKGILKSKIVLGCDGANSTVAKTFGAKPQEIVTGLIAKTAEKSADTLIHLWFDKNFVKDGFLWKIPRGSETEYGCLGSNVNFSLLEKFFKIKNYKKSAGIIPFGPPKTFFDRTLLIGDSAAQTKPWSGGGIVYGFTCGQIAAEVILQAFRQEDFSEKFLSQYENLWKEKIGKFISLGMLGRKMLSEMSNQELDEIFRKLKGFDFGKLDMDYLTSDLSSLQFLV